MLHGLFFERSDTKRVFLVSEGKGGNIYHRLNQPRVLIPCGGSVLQYDYEGYGQSDGRPSLDGVCDDLTGAYDFLVQHEHRSPRDVIAFGDSFGTGPTGQLVLRRRVGAVVLQSGFSSLLRASRDRLPWLRLYPDALFPRQAMDNIAVFSKPHPPLLIVHGTKDDMLSFSNAEDLYKAAIEPKQMFVIEGEGHGAFGKFADFRDTLATFLKKYQL